MRSIWASVFVFLGVASNQWYVAENRQLLGLQRTLLGLIINIALNFIFIPKFGVIGAAVATLCGKIVAAWLFDLLQSSTRSVFLMKAKSFNLIRICKKLIKE